MSSVQIELWLTSLPPLMVLMLIIWLVQCKTKNIGWVDFGWTLGLVLTSGLYFVMAPGYAPRKLLIFIMVTLWGGRLLTLLLSRLAAGRKEDRRYMAIRKGWSKHLQLKLFFFFQLEAVLAVILSLPFLLISWYDSPPLTMVEFTGAFIWLIGFIGEIIADDQKKAFRENPLNRARICQAGLWNYSRHPNYFFDWMTWLGYAVMAAAVPGGWLGFCAPIIMLFLFLKVTGVPLAEEFSLKSYGAQYRAYQQTTSMFIPLPKKKGPAHVQHG